MEKLKDVMEHLMAGAWFMVWFCLTVMLYNKGYEICSLVWIFAYPLVSWVVLTGIEKINEKMKGKKTK